MKVFFVGDFTTNTGPAMVNRLLIKGLGHENIVYTKSRNKINRFIEFIYKTMFSDCICFCSYSKLNLLGLKITQFLNKNSYYLMHGYKTYEEKINNPEITFEELKSINEKEKELLKGVDKIFCVSKRFMEFMKQAEPDFQDKFDYNHNPINLQQIEDITGKYNKVNRNKKIVSSGGGMKQKNNLEICKAIDKLNREKELDLEYVVIGLPHSEKKEICSYEFVTYHDNLTHDKVLEILSGSYLYIQNSTFETFGLAVIEALACNCNLLISDHVGAIGVLNTISNEDVIYNVENIDEIAQKIEMILSNDNYQRLQQGLNRNEIDYKISSKNLLKKIINNSTFDSQSEVV